MYVITSPERREFEALFETKTGRDRWTVRLALMAVGVSLLALIITFLQWRSGERAANVAEQSRLDAKKASEDALKQAEKARVDANAEAERQRVDAQANLAQQRRDSAAALAAQTKRVDRANALADRSAEAAEQTAKAAALQAEVADRPWLSVEVSITGPLEYRDNGLFLMTDVTVTNWVRSPATGFTIGGELIPMGISDIDFNELTERERVCNSAKEPVNASPYAFSTLFPGRAEPRQTYWGPSGRFSVDEALKKGKGTIVPLVFVCATYHTAYSDSVHQTAVVLGVWDAGDPPDRANYRGVTLNGAKTIPASRLILKPLRGIGGSFAN